MSMAKRALSPRFWHRVVAVHGLSGVWRAGIRTLKTGKTVSGVPDHLDLTEITDDPIEAMYQGVELGQVPVIVIPISQLRVEKLGIRVDDVDANPYTRTVAEFLSGEHLDYEDSTLQRFLDRWQPETIGEFLGLDDVSPESRLNEPLHSDLLPWARPSSSEELAERRVSVERSWAVKLGPPPAEGHGSTTYGPASDTLGRYRFAKHTDVAVSMVEVTAGRDRSDPHWWEPERGGYIEVQLLANGKRVVGIVREGKHRTAALAALGAETLLVSLPPTYPVVHRGEVTSWPGVSAGAFTIDQALRVFDRFMEGKPPWGHSEFLDPTQAARQLFG